jgi:chemotaxis protein MotB
MEFAQQPGASGESTYVSSPPERRTSVKAILTGLVLLGGLCGVSYYALKLQAEAEALRTELSASQKEIVSLRASERQTQQALADLRAEREEEAALYKQAKESLEQVNAELAATQSRLDELNAERGAIEEQLAEFRQMTEQLRKMIDTGKLQVNFRRGRMVVELPAQVLFPSGSADLTDDGRKDLAEVAKILRSMKTRHFIVAGHTDNVPVSGKFASNWELSTARAVNVTEALIRGGMRPEQLVAAGYGEYDPVARNTNEKNRQKNRRIEIILEPRLRPLPELKSEKLAKNEAAAKRK